MESKIKIKIYKTLSRNDTGETHSHQSGISIPKEIANTSVFPKLGTERLNPREEITFYDDTNTQWKFQYIYYNDLYFGKERRKAHDEYRLTCVTKYIKQNSIKSGDTIWFSIDDNDVRRIGFERQVENEEEVEIKEKTVSNVIKLSNGWRYIEIKGGRKK